MALRVKNSTYQWCRNISTKGKIKPKWMFLKKNTTGRHVALKYFDDRYGPYFGDQWPSIRLALLSQQKYCAVLNNFAFTEKDLLSLSGAFDIIRETENWKDFIKPNDIREPEDDINYQVRHDEEMNDVVTDDNLSLDGNDDDNELEEYTNQWESMAEFIPSPKTKLKGPHGAVIELAADGNMDYLNLPDISHVNDEEEMTISPHLKVYAYPRGDITLFPEPKHNDIGFLGYYLMDAASILPVLALNLRPSDRVLDMCAAPGGKTLLIAQTRCFEELIANDPTLSRRMKLQQVLRSHIPKSVDSISVRGRNGITWFRNPRDDGVFNKILVDSPCTTDRHMLFEDDNNIFETSRALERADIEEKQKALLLSALEMVEVGGSVVYSTCTLSPMQNDVVVRSVLQQLEEERPELEVAPCSLHSLARRFSPIFQFHAPSRGYGLLVLPKVTKNFGPMYLCKLRRMK